MSVLRRSVRAVSLAMVIGIVAAACGGGTDAESNGADVTVAPANDGSVAETTVVTSTTPADDGEAGEDSDGDGFPDDDAAEIVGNPDLDLDELEEVAPDAAEALDEIDDIVSIGDCGSETVGLMMTYVPDGWQCRGFDAPIGGLDGFTLFKPENPGGIEITIGTPSPLGVPCEALQMCDQAETIDLGSNFDMQQVEMLGVPLIFGTHTTVDAEVSVVTLEALSDDDVAFITMVLNGVEEY